MPSKGAGLVYQVVLGLISIPKCLKTKPRTPFNQPEAPVEEEECTSRQHKAFNLSRFGHAGDMCAVEGSWSGVSRGARSKLNL